MPKTSDSISLELYELLKIKGFRPEGIKQGKKSIKPEDATSFNFHFKNDDKEYAAAHCAIDNLKNLYIFYNKDAMRSAGANWTNFLKELKNWATRHGLGMKLDPLDNLPDYTIRRESSEKLSEGYYGTKYTSYSDKTPTTVKLIIKHNRALGENDQRHRYVEKIFVENEHGERFALPTKKPSEGYAYARLIADGGNPYDERGKHIAELSEDINKLGKFIRATRNKQFNEGVHDIIESALQKYAELRETMHKLRTSRGFRNYFDNWTPTLLETNDTDNLETIFRTNSIDSRIEQALPVLSKYNINLKNMKEALEFEDWCDTMISENLLPSLDGQIEELVDLLKSDSDPIALGPDASNAIGIIEEYIQDSSLFKRLRKAAAADVDNDARPVIIGWMSEHSDDSNFEEILKQLDSDSTDSTERDDTDDLDSSESNDDQNDDINNDEADTVPPDNVPPPQSDNNEENNDDSIESDSLNISPNKKDQLPLKESELYFLNRLRALSGL